MAVRNAKIFFQPTRSSPQYRFLNRELRNVNILFLHRKLWNRRAYGPHR